jgi:hypothetical protein
MPSPLGIIDPAPTINLGQEPETEEQSLSDGDLEGAGTPDSITETQYEARMDDLHRQLEQERLLRALAQERIARKEEERRAAAFFTEPPSTPSARSTSRSTYTGQAESTHTVRMKDPEPFKARTIKEATTFLRQLETIFRINARDFESEERRILYASQFLTGPAADRWWQRYPSGVDGGLTFELRLRCSRRSSQPRPRRGY